MDLLSEPLLTREMRREQVELVNDSTYIRGSGVEERSRFADDWRNRMVARGVQFVLIEDEMAPDLILVSATRLGLDRQAFQLRDQGSLQQLMRDLGEVCLDITGLSYAAWAPLVRAALATGEDFRVAYVEPLDYRRSLAPSRGMLFDLSEGIEGIAPLPGFASIRRPRGEDACLVPLLGFEGTRLAHVLDVTEPSPERVVPVVGLPGFRPEFPAHAFIGNRSSLDSDFLFAQVRYAKANCPFDLFHRLVEIQADYSNSPLRVAPVGTKPHGLGAVLFAISRPGVVEIVYDHPRRKASRTVGEARVCMYDVSAFAQSDLFTRSGAYEP